MPVAVYLGKFDWGGTNFTVIARYTRLEDRHPQNEEAWILTNLQITEGYWPQDADSAGLNMTNTLTNKNIMFVLHVYIFELHLFPPLLCYSD